MADNRGERDCPCFGSGLIYEDHSSRWKDVSHAESISRRVPPRRHRSRPQGEAPLRQIAKDFGSSEGCLDGWLEIAGGEDGITWTLSPSKRQGTLIDRRINYFTAPPFTADEALNRPSPIPPRSGVYGWWFRTIPHPEINTAGCETRDGLTLLYAGISPSRPPTNGKPASSQNIRRRIRTHYRGNAEGSTLRKTLGCLLSNELGIELRRVGSGNRRTFHAGEKLLTQWMAANALVSWVEHPEPWVLEDELIAHLDLPLNLQGNRRHAFHPGLSEARRKAMERANALGVV